MSPHHFRQYCVRHDLEVQLTAIAMAERYKKYPSSERELGGLGNSKP
jgi:hypothetical protein